MPWWGCARGLFALARNVAADVQRVTSLEATEALAQYGWPAVDVVLVSSKPDKPVWMVAGPKRPAYLKRLPYKRSRVLFTTGAADYLYRRGAGVSEVIPTRTGALSAQVGRANYVLFAATGGRTPEYVRDLDLIGCGLAEFHERSQGYVAPEGAMALDHFDTWALDYRQGTARLRVAGALASEAGAAEPQALTAMAKPKAGKDRGGVVHRRSDADSKAGRWARSTTPPSDTMHPLSPSQDPSTTDAPDSGPARMGRLLSGYVRQALNDARRATVLLASEYQPVAEAARQARFLCHQDFAAGNLRVDDDGHLMAFDLDSVAYDLPVRDLRKLLNKIMKIQGEWDADLALRLVRAYAAVRPLSAGEYALLLADLQFPHLLAGLAKKLYIRSQAEWPQSECERRLQAIVQLEASKARALSRLAEAWGVAS